MERNNLASPPLGPPKGTLLAQFGDRLVRVRHRHDEGTGRTFKTVELIIEEITDRTRADPPSRSRIVRLRVGWHELEIRQAVKEAGGRWNPQERVWELQHDRIIDLGLEERIVRDPSSQT